MERIVMILLLCLSCLAYGQKGFSIKNRVVLAKTQRTIVDVIADPTNNNYLQSFRTELGKSKIETGEFAGLDVYDHQIGFVGPDGHEMLLRKNEDVRAYLDGKLLTASYNLDKHTKELTLYEVKDNKVDLYRKITLDNLETSDYILPNGNIVITDEWEGYGTKVDVYTGDLELIGTYLPFDGSYRGTLVTSNKDHIVICSQSSDDKEALIAIMSARTGKILNEGKIEIDLTTDIQKLQSCGDHILVYSSFKLYCFSMNGRFLWLSNDREPIWQLHNDGNDRIYAFTRGKVECIDASTGQNNWQWNLTELGDIHVGENQVLRVLSFQLLDNSIAFVLSSTKSGTLFYDDFKYNNRLVLINSIGETEILRLDQRLKSALVRRKDRGFQVVNENEIVTYEK